MNLRLPTRSRWRSPLALLLPLAATSALALPWLALPEARASETSFFLPNEAIGTLPGYWVDDAPWWAWLYFSGNNIMDTQVATTAYVPECLMDAFIVGADGKGFVLLDHPSDPEVVRMRFYGDVRLRFDASMLASGTAEILGSIGALFANGQASVIVGGRPSDAFSLPECDGELDLPVAALASGSMPAFDVWVQSSNGGATGFLRLTKSTWTVRVWQDMP